MARLGVDFGAQGPLPSIDFGPVRVPSGVDVGTFRVRAFIPNWSSLGALLQCRSLRQRGAAAVSRVACSIRRSTSDARRSAARRVKPSYRSLQCTPKSLVVRSKRPTPLPPTPPPFATKFIPGNRSQVRLKIDLSWEGLLDASCSDLGTHLGGQVGPKPEHRGVRFASCT